MTQGNKNNKNNNNNSDINSGIITPTYTKSQMITQLNEWKELYINDVESYSVGIGDVEEAVLVLNDFIMYIKYLD